MMKTNSGFDNLDKSYLFAKIRKEKEKYAGERLFDMSVGDVCLPLSKSVINAIQSAALEMGSPDSFKGYPPPFGYDFLRKAIAEKYRALGISIKPDEIYVSDGAKSDVANIADIFEPQSVIIPSPAYPVYADSNIIKKNKITYLSAGEENGFVSLPAENLPRESLIYLCSPNNPAGVAYPRDALEKWVDFALDSGSVIIYDSSYEAYVRSGAPRSIYGINGAERCAVEISSLSKSAGFTGLRCSWTVIPKALEATKNEVFTLWERRQSTFFNGVSYVIQRAAEAALCDYSDIRAKTDYYLENARLIRERFDDTKIRYFGGVDSPYIWIKCPAGTDSETMFSTLISEYGTVLTPGAGFGNGGYMRVSTLTKRETAKGGVERICKYYGRI
ncbi:MAG: LL-diaminopimelate aminotransferase [Clostridiales bacterium]|nr:LL-diaminopimelate aminotransferase [Clostridiales bacterium]